MITVRLPNKLVLQLDAADGSRTSVITAALQAYLPASEPEPVERDKRTDKAA